MVSFFGYQVPFCSGVFAYNKYIMCFSNCFGMFCPILFFHPKWQFCKGYSLCMEAIFANIQNGLIFLLTGGFKALFAKNNYKVLRETFFVWFVQFSFWTQTEDFANDMFLAILFFNPNWWFCKGYSLCMKANFANIQNAFIFRILGDFESGFLHGTTIMCF